MTSGRICVKSTTTNGGYMHIKVQDARAASAGSGNARYISPQGYEPGRYPSTDSMPLDECFDGLALRSVEGGVGAGSRRPSSHRDGWRVRAGTPRAL